MFCKKGQQKSRFWRGSIVLYQINLFCEKKLWLMFGRAQPISDKVAPPRTKNAIINIYFIIITTNIQTNES